MNNRHLRTMILSFLILPLLTLSAFAGVGDARVTDAKGETSELKKSELKLTFVSGESKFAVDPATVSSIKVTPAGNAQLMLRTGKTYSGAVSGTISGETELGQYSLDAGKLRELVLVQATQPNVASTPSNPRAITVTDAKGTVTSIANGKLTSFVVLRGKTQYEVDTSLIKGVSIDGDQCTVEFTIGEDPIVGTVSSGELSGQSDLGDFTIQVAKTKTITFPVSSAKPVSIPTKQPGVTLQVTDTAGKSTTFMGATWQWNRYESHCRYLIHSFCDCGGDTVQDDRPYLPMVLPGGYARVMLHKIESLSVKKQGEDKVVVVVSPKDGPALTGVIGSLPGTFRGGCLSGTTPTAKVRLDPGYIAGLSSTQGGGAGLPDRPDTKKSAYSISLTMKDGASFDVISACVAEWGSQNNQGIPSVGSTAMDVTVGEANFNVSFDKILELNGFSGKPLEVELVTTTGGKKTVTMKNEYQQVGGWTTWGDVWANLDGLSSVKFRHKTDAQRSTGAGQTP